MRRRRTTIAWPSFAVWVLVAGVLPGCLQGALPEPDPDQIPRPSGFSVTAVFPGEYETDGPASVVLHQGTLDRLAPEVVQVEAEDGISLAIQLHRPATPARVPVIAVYSPYFSPTFEFGFDDPGQAALVPNFVPHGYVVAYVAARGTGASGSCNDFSYGSTYLSDANVFLDWLGTQPWSNGNVGLIGMSAPSTLQWVAAATGNAHLKTIVPMAGTPDWWHRLYPNGTATYNGVTRPTDAPTPADETDGCPSTNHRQAESETLVTKERGTGYWVERDYRARILANYRGTIFRGHGFQDNVNTPASSFPLVADLERRGTPVKSFLGQWGHSWPDGSPERNAGMRWDWAETLLHWFDYWLKEDHSIDLGAHVEVQDTALQWRIEKQWPPLDAVSQSLLLSADGRLVASSPLAGEVPLAPDGAVDSLAGYAARRASEASGEDLSPPPVGCASCKSFRTDPLPSGLRIVGAARLHATVIPSASTGYLTATLAVEAAGATTIVTDGMIDLMRADGTEVPTPVVPGQPLIVRLQFDQQDVYVPPEGRVVVTVSLGAAGGRVPTDSPTPLVVAAGPGSVFSFETVERESSVLFQPPGPL